MGENCELHSLVEICSVEFIVGPVLHGTKFISFATDPGATKIISRHRYFDNERELTENVTTVGMLQLERTLRAMHAYNASISTTQIEQEIEKG